MRKLVVKIASDGQLSIEGEGFSGASCLDKSKKYIQGLGVAEKSEKKPEYYEQPEVTTQVY